MKSLSHRARWLLFAVLSACGGQSNLGDIAAPDAAVSDAFAAVNSVDSSTNDAVTDVAVPLQAGYFAGLLKLEYGDVKPKFSPLPPDPPGPVPVVVSINADLRQAVFGGEGFGTVVDLLLSGDAVTNAKPFILRQPINSIAYGWPSPQSDTSPSVFLFVTSFRLRRSTNGVTGTLEGRWGLRGGDTFEEIPVTGNIIANVDASPTTLTPSSSLIHPMDVLYLSASQPLDAKGAAALLSTSGFESKMQAITAENGNQIVGFRTTTALEPGVVFEVKTKGLKDLRGGDVAVALSKIKTLSIPLSPTDGFESGEDGLFKGNVAWTSTALPYRAILPIGGNRSAVLFVADNDVNSSLTLRLKPASAHTKLVMKVRVIDVRRARSKFYGIFIWSTGIAPLRIAPLALKVPVADTKEGLLGAVDTIVVPLSELASNPGEVFLDIRHFAFPLSTEGGLVLDDVHTE